MVMLQVKNLPEALHAALVDRAKAEGVTMSTYVTRLLRVDLQRPTLREWVLEQEATDDAPRPSKAREGRTRRGARGARSTA